MIFLKVSSHLTRTIVQVLNILESLGKRLHSPPHYPMRPIMELAGKLGIPVSQARSILDFLEKENLVRYSCAFEAEDEGQNKTAFTINPIPGFSTVFA